MSAKGDYLAHVVWQEVIALAIVAATAGLFARRYLGRNRLGFERKTSCGCGAGKASLPRGSIVFRARKGGRREVVVRTQ